MNRLLWRHGWIAGQDGRSGVIGRYRRARPGGRQWGGAGWLALVTTLGLVALAACSPPGSARPASSPSVTPTADLSTVPAPGPPAADSLSAAPPVVADSVAVQARYRAVRQALRAGRAATATAALAQASALPAQVPGLFVRAALLGGNEAGACGLDVQAAGPAGQWHRARCAWRRGARGDVAARPEAVAALKVLATEAPALLFFDDEAVAMVLEVTAWGSPADRGMVLGAALGRPVPPFDAAARVRLGKVLRALVDRSPRPELAVQAVERLVYDLPEQARGTDRARLGAAANSPAARIRRATALEQQHQNAAVIDLVGDLVGQDCGAALLVARTERKLRRYAAARAALAAAPLTSCTPDQQRRAQYLEIRLATLQQSPDSERLVAAFAERWGTDSFVDDVLVWLEEVRAARGDPAGARAVLERIVAEHPGGDMADEARFRLAMELALEGDARRARTVLDGGGPHQQAVAVPRPLLLDRARYWSARLQAMPDPRTWAPAAASADLVAGRAALAAFAADRPAGFYGHLAGLVVQHLGGPAPQSAVRRAASLGPDARVPVPDTLAQMPSWRQARAAAETGFDDEAAVLLADIEVGRGDLEAAAAVAALFASVDRPDLAHRTMRRHGLALLPGAPVDDTSLACWTLAWPLAHEAVLTAAATAQGVPSPLLWGLAREESAFDASVASWAGAAGLCQLMPATANEEAGILRLPRPTSADLTDPALNARLGASHLGRRLRGMGHPLKAIAAYNAGPGSVAKWMPPSGQSVPVDYWVEQIPYDETRNYVKYVTGSWVTYTLLYGGDSIAYSLDIVGR